MHRATKGDFMFDFIAAEDDVRFFLKLIPSAIIFLVTLPIWIPAFIYRRWFA